MVLFLHAVHSNRRNQISLRAQSFLIITCRILYSLILIASNNSDLILFCQTQESEQEVLSGIMTLTLLFEVVLCLVSTLVQPPGNYYALAFTASSLALNIVHWYSFYVLPKMDINS